MIEFKLNNTYISTSDAIKIARNEGYILPRQTVCRWAKKYGIGKKMTGRGITSPYIINREKFIITLRALKDGNTRCLEIMNGWVNEEK
jgi:hypothetical protein